jgi:uncharacterized Tic20 family protein
MTEPEQNENQAAETPPEAPAAPAPAATPSTSSSDKDFRMWAMILHFSLLAGFVIPLGGLIAPIIIWQIKKEEFPALNEHAYSIFNWMLSALIYAVVCGILTLVVIGVFGFMALAVVGVIFPIIGGIKANEGVLWPYPLTLNLLKP